MNLKLIYEHVLYTIFFNSWSMCVDLVTFVAKLSMYIPFTWRAALLYTERSHFGVY